MSTCICPSPNCPMDHRCTHTWPGPPVLDVSPEDLRCQFKAGHDHGHHVTGILIGEDGFATYPSWSWRDEDEVTPCDIPADVPKYHKPHR